MSSTGDFGQVAQVLGTPGRWIVRLISLAVLIVLGSLLWPAQPSLNAGVRSDVYLPLVYGSPATPVPDLPEDTLVRGRVAPAGQPANYAYAAKAPGWVSVRMFGDDTLDPYLILIAPTGIALCTDDNAAGVGNGAFFSCYLPSAGKYTLAAASSAGTAGSFRLLLEKGRSAHLADINHDCTVGSGDLNGLLNCWGSAPIAGPCAGADLNLDGRVETADATIMSVHWGRTCDP